MEQLTPDPRNREIFDPVEGDDFEALVESIRTNGIINPISITATGLIIAGEQRYRAARTLGLETVPVIVHYDLDDDDPKVTLLRVDENIRRRSLKISETARAVKAWHDATAKPVGTNRYTNGSSSTVDELEMPEAIASMSPSTRTIYTKLAALIEPLAFMLDTKQIGTQVAYQLAQLSKENQEALAAATSEEELAELTESDAKELKERLKARDAEVAELHRRLEQTAEGQQSLDIMGLALAGMREQHAKELAALEASVEDRVAERTEHFEAEADAADAARARSEQLVTTLRARMNYEAKDPVHNAIKLLVGVIASGPEAHARFTIQLGEQDGFMWPFIDMDAQQALSVANVLTEYSRLLRAALDEKGLSISGLRSLT